MSLPGRDMQQLQETRRDIERKPVTMREACSNSIDLKETVINIQRQWETGRDMQRLTDTGRECEREPATVNIV